MQIAANRSLAAGPRHAQPSGVVRAHGPSIFSPCLQHNQRSLVACSVATVTERVQTVASTSAPTNAVELNQHIREGHYEASLVHLQVGGGCSCRLVIALFSLSYG